MRIVVRPENSMRTAAQQPYVVSTGFAIDTNQVSVAANAICRGGGGNTVAQAVTGWSLNTVREFWILPLCIHNIRENICQSCFWSLCRYKLTINDAPSFHPTQHYSPPDDVRIDVSDIPYHISSQPRWTALLSQSVLNASNINFRTVQGNSEQSTTELKHM